MKTRLVGDRLVLVGSVLYLLEWVGIIAGHVGAPLGAGASAGAVHQAYAGSADAFGWAAGWFSVVLLGRVVLMVGVRSALVDSGRRDVLMDVAVLAMTVSVAVEVAVYAVVAGAAWYLDAGGGLATTRALDAVAYQSNEMLWGPAGVSLLCAGAAMWRSALFPRVLAGLALVAGGLLGVVGLALVAPRFADLANGLTSGALLFWVWMLWTGVLAWRATPREREVQPVATV